MKKKYKVWQVKQDRIPSDKFNSYVCSCGC